MYVGTQSNVSVGENSPYIFTTKYLTNNNVSYDNKTGVFTIKTPGWYKVHFDTSAGSTSNIIPSLISGNNTIAYGEAISSAVGNYVNIAFETVLRIVPSDSNSFTKFTIINTGSAATTLTSNIIIERIA